MRKIIAYFVLFSIFLNISSIGFAQAAEPPTPPPDYDMTKWFIQGRQYLKITDHGGEARPTIDIGPNMDPAVLRPALTFQFAYLISRSGKATNNGLLFYFCISTIDGQPASSKYQNACLRIPYRINAAMGAEATMDQRIFVYDIKDPTNPQDENDSNNYFTDKFRTDTDDWKTTFTPFIENRIFNTKEGDTTTKTIYNNGAGVANPLYTGPEDAPENFVNYDDDGWLAHWNIGHNTSSITDPTGDAGTDPCGCTKAKGSWIWRSMLGAFCSLVCLFYNFGVDFQISACNLFNQALGTIGNGKKSTCNNKENLIQLQGSNSTN